MLTALEEDSSLESQEKYVNNRHYKLNIITNKYNEEEFRISRWKHVI